ncbi:MAG TPA: hypothetical protein VGJ84_09915 [Polyangiaceae bacterium]
MAAVFPKGLEPWTQKQPFRVEHFARHDGALQRVYLEGAAEASAFADHRTTWGGARCVVESRDMVATHEVRTVAVPTGYTLSIRRFGDIDSARADFARGKAELRVERVRLSLLVIGDKTPIETFTHTGS